MVLIKRIFAALITCCASLPLFAGWGDVNMTPGVNALSREIFDLHMTIFWICVVIGALVLGFMVYLIVAFRKKEGDKPAQFDDHPVLEMTWTVLFAVILAVMAIPATFTMIRAYDDAEGDINILITGHQWKWQYEYLEDEVSFFSNLSTDLDQRNNIAPKSDNYLLEVDEPLVIPTNKRIRFLITANDVIHSWWVPDFAIKQDAIPGFINTAWTRAEETGIYRGNCTELCGKNHGFMPVVVKVVEKDEYNDWVLSKKEEAIKLAELTEKEWSLAELTQRGEGVYQKNCVACHQMNGEGLPPIFPALAGSDIVMFDKDRNVEILMEGVQGAAMQSFANQLSEVDMAAVITYTRQAWGNAENGDGEYVVPSDIVEYKKPKI